LSEETAAFDAARIKYSLYTLLLKKQQSHLYT